MKKVHIKARNIKSGDVLKDGRRVGKGRIHQFDTRKGCKRVMLVLNNPNGYGLQTLTLNGEERIVVKRPKYNMENVRVSR